MRLLAVIIGIWICWIGYQYLAKSSQATALVQQKMEEIASLDPDIILNRMGKLPEQKEAVLLGQKYWVSWWVYGTPLWNSNEAIKEVEVRGKVYFIELFPLTGLKFGYSFRVVVKINA